MNRRIELPKGCVATQQPPLELTESFAEFQGSSERHEGVLITRRRLLLRSERGYTRSADELQGIPKSNFGLLQQLYLFSVYLRTFPKQ